MTLIPDKYTISIWAGTTYRRTITALSGGQGSAPRDLTGYAATLKMTPASGTPSVYTLSTSNSQITLNGVQGLLTLYIPATDTATFTTWGGGSYQLVITASNGAGDSDALLYGPVRILSPS